MAPEDFNKQYPCGPDFYTILYEIGAGVSSTVYKALCHYTKTAVAIKVLDLDKLSADFEYSVRREKTNIIMSLLPHRNILSAYCSFIVCRKLWIIMPFMAEGSLQSLMWTSFPDGFREELISVVLKEILNALVYLHQQGHLQNDVKPANILVDEYGTVKLADSGFSASLYASRPGYESGSSVSSSRPLLSDVAGSAYWMAPEVIRSEKYLSRKADIWSFGITALELAHGRPPLPHDLPLYKSLFMQIKNRFRFFNHEKSGNKDMNKTFSDAFKEMLASCLDQDPAKRPSAEELLKHPFFTNQTMNTDFLLQNILKVLPRFEDRYKINMNLTKNAVIVDSDEDRGLILEKERRISGWRFNKSEMELNPIFVTKSMDCHVTRKVRFGGATIIQEKGADSNLCLERNFEEDVPPEGEITVGGEAGTEITNAGVKDKAGIEDDAGAAIGVENEVVVQAAAGSVGVEGGLEVQAVAGAVDAWLLNAQGICHSREYTVNTLLDLRRNLDEQRRTMTELIRLLGGEAGLLENELLVMVDKLATEVDTQWKRNQELEMELVKLRLEASRPQNPPAA